MDATDSPLAPAPDGTSLPLACPHDDEIALGCECANPALQIEWWGHDEETRVRTLVSSKS